MGSVIVQHQMDFPRLRRKPGIDVLHELEELLVAMATAALADHFAGGDVQGREQRGRAVALLVVGSLFRQPRSQRQNRLGAIQRLHL